MLTRIARSFVSLLLALWIVAPISGCNVMETAIRTTRLEKRQTGTIERLHTYDWFFLTSQPQPDDFKQARYGKVRTVIDLRLPEEERGFNERELTTSIGMRYSTRLDRSLHDRPNRGDDPGVPKVLRGG